MMAASAVGTGGAPGAPDLALGGGVHGLGGAPAAGRRQERRRPAVPAHALASAPGIGVGAPAAAVGGGRLARRSRAAYPGRAAADV